MTAAIATLNELDPTNFGLLLVFIVVILVVLGLILRGGGLAMLRTPERLSITFMFGDRPGRDRTGPD